MGRSKLIEHLRIIGKLDFLLLQLFCLLKANIVLGLLFFLLLVDPSADEKIKSEPLNTVFIARLVSKNNYNNPSPSKPFFSKTNQSDFEIQ